jgi:arylsulfatase A-like enzyme
MAAIGFGQSRASQTDDRAARAAVEWIRKRSGPWMAWVSLINPHDVYFPPGSLENVTLRSGVRAPISDMENLANKPAEQAGFARRAGSAKYQGDGWLRYRSYYCELVEKVDALLGVLLDAAGDLDSAIVAYTSDHGDGLGEHGLPFKGPFMYEELIRIPLIIAAPAGAVGRGVRTEFATQADMLPTLAALSGVPAPANLDGINIAAKGQTRDAVLLEYCGQQHDVYPIRTIRTRRWKLNWYDSGGKELYDLERDAHELRNLAGTAAAREVQQELERRIEAWRPSLTELERSQPGRYLKSGGAQRRS